VTTSLAEGSSCGPGEASGRARLAVLASGSGSNLGAILTACANGLLNADVVLVAGDRPNAGAFDRARAAGVPATVILEVPSDKTQRRSWASELGELVAAHQPDWVILAGFMRILPTEFLHQFPNRVVNLHPALPGEFPGTHAIERALTEAKNGLRTSTGIMVHFVPDEGVDDGPVLATQVVPILPSDDIETLSTRVHHAEHALLVETLRTLTSTPATMQAATTPVPPDPTRN
jgi:phosphoribosylglycinamide formyltransferase 1